MDLPIHSRVPLIINGRSWEYNFSLMTVKSFFLQSGSSAHISSGHGGEGRVRRIDYTPSDCCRQSLQRAQPKGLAAAGEFLYMFDLLGKI